MSKTVLISGAAGMLVSSVQDWSDGLRIVDIPTTMNVIEESIEMRLGGKAVADPGSPEWMAIERDESSRFFSVLQRLIRADRETAFLQDTVVVHSGS